MASAVTPPTLARLGAWRLERDERVVALAATPGLTAYAESTAASAREHRCPAWKLVLPLAGSRIYLDGERHTRPIVVPPMRLNTARCDGPFAALFIDAWLLTEPPVAPGAALAAELTGWSAQFLAGAETVLPVDLVESWAGPRGVPGRVAVAVETLRYTDDLGTPERALGLSASRTRALVRRELGYTLGDVRRWLRLVRAYIELGRAGVAISAAEAGFADQPHLTRTSAAYLGRPPGAITHH